MNRKRPHCRHTIVLIWPRRYCITSNVYRIHIMSRQSMRDGRIARGILCRVHYTQQLQSAAEDAAMIHGALAPRRTALAPSNSSHETYNHENICMEILTRQDLDRQLTYLHSTRTALDRLAFNRDHDERPHYSIPGTSHGEPVQCLSPKPGSKASIVLTVKRPTMNTTVRRAHLYFREKLRVQSGDDSVGRVSPHHGVCFPASRLSVRENGSCGPKSEVGGTVFVPLHGRSCRRSDERDSGYNTTYLRRSTSLFLCWNGVCRGIISLW